MYIYVVGHILHADYKLQVQTAHCTMHHAVHINCQQLGIVCQLNLNIGIGLSLPTIVGIYMSIEVSVRPLGVGLGKVYSLKYVHIF